VQPSSIFGFIFSAAGTHIHDRDFVSTSIPGLRVSSFCSAGQALAGSVSFLSSKFLSSFCALRFLPLPEIPWLGIWSLLRFDFWYLISTKVKAMLLARVDVALWSSCPAQACWLNFSVFDSLLVCCELLQGIVGKSVRVAGSKDSRIRGSNRSSAVVSRTRLSGVRWNVCEDINYFWVVFLSSIVHVVLLASFRISVVVPSPVLKTDSLSIARRSWPN
jgi:hypothetical protein